MIYLNTTAAHHWLHTGGRRGTPCPAGSLSRAEASTVACRDSLRAFGPSLPFYEPIVGRANRKSAPDVRFHTYRGRFDKESFLQVNATVCMASPELAFVQMARSLLLDTLIGLGCALGGSYQYSTWAPVGFEAREPLTSIKALTSYARRNGHLSGARKALRALGYVKENSASPAETKSALLMSLPCNLGGYGIRELKLNYRIDITRRSASVASKRFYVADMALPKRKIAIEYDSNLIHANARGIAADSKKRNALLLEGWTVISLTHDQLYNEVETDKVARVVMPLAKDNRAWRSLSFQEKKRALRQKLFHLAAIFPPESSKSTAKSRLSCENIAFWEPKRFSVRRYRRYEPVRPGQMQPRTSSTRSRAPKTQLFCIFSRL